MSAVVGRVPGAGLHPAPRERIHVGRGGALQRLREAARTSDADDGDGGIPL